MRLNVFPAFLVAATSSYMIIAVGIANQYELLGDGKINTTISGAIQARPDNGLPWHNLGVLMERLGAIRQRKLKKKKRTRNQLSYNRNGNFITMPI